MDPRRLSPAQFFALGLDDGHMTAAQNGSRIAYSTILDAKSGKPLRATTAKRLEDWSRTVPAARALNVCIGAAIACDLEDPPVALPKRLTKLMAEHAAKSARKAA